MAESVPPGVSSEYLSEYHWHFGYEFNSVGRHEHDGSRRLRLPPA
jgi:hypothetical protein